MRPTRSNMPIMKARNSRVACTDPAANPRDGMIVLLKTPPTPTTRANL